MKKAKHPVAVALIAEADHLEKEYDRGKEKRDVFLIARVLRSIAARIEKGGEK